MTDIVPLFKALADERRIKLLAAIVDRGRSVQEIARAANLPPRAVTRQLGTLLETGLIEATPGSPVTYRFCRQPLLEALRSLSERFPAPQFDGDLDEYDQKVLGTFLVDGKLSAIPAQQKKRDVILRFLADRFEPDRMYSEKEVNGIIREYHEDVASLRRWLVDMGLLQRQIVRVVDADGLMQGAPQVEHRISYWKPNR